MNHFYFIETLMLSLHPLADHLYDLVATRSLLRYSDSFSEKYFVVITTFLEKIYLKSCWLSLCWKEYTRWYIQSLHVIPAEFESSQEINLTVFLPKWHTSRTEALFYLFIYFFFGREDLGRLFSLSSVWQKDLCV